MNKKIKTLLTSFLGVYLVPTENLVAQAFSNFLSWLYRFALSAAAILAVLMIVIGGLQYIISGGNAEKRSSAKRRIEQAIFGLLIAVAAWLILYTINPDLVNSVLNIDCVGPSCTGGS